MASAAQLDFPGVATLVAAIDDAVAQADTGAIVNRLRGNLCALIQDESVRLPDAVFTPQAEGYARRELYHSAQHGYSVMAMTWAPGQGTPIHDHCGMWCVEGVWAGQVEVVQYEKIDQADDLYKFESRGAMVAGVGSAGSLIPPHEFHTIANTGREEIAVSVHVYSDQMTTCNVFTPLGDNWYKRCPRQLTCTEVA